MKIYKIFSHFLRFSRKLIYRKIIIFILYKMVYEEFIILPWLFLSISSYFIHQFDVIKLNKMKLQKKFKSIQIRPSWLMRSGFFWQIKIKKEKSCLKKISLQMWGHDFTNVGAFAIWACIHVIITLHMYQKAFVA